MDEQFLGDSQGAIDFLRAQLYTSDKVGVIGYCSGGRQAFLAGCRLPIDATVNCYGSRVVPKPEELSANPPLAVIDMTPDLACPMLVLSGEEDPNPPPSTSSSSIEALETNNKDFEAQAYSNTGHGFFLGRPTVVSSGSRARRLATDLHLLRLAPAGRLSDQSPALMSSIGATAKSRRQ